MNKTKSIAPLCLLFVACQDEPEHDDTPDVEYRSVTAHDAGDVSFVRQAVPALLGRKVRGSAEIEVLTDLIAEVGRPRLVSALTAQPEYLDYWPGFWMDALRVSRAGPKAQETCYGAPTRPVSGQLARLLHNRAGSDGHVVGIGAGLNMRDVLLSSLVEDDISVAYRAHLFPMLSHNDFSANDKDEFFLRRQVAETFIAAYTDRNPDCVACHNSGWSVTGAASGWNRTYPIFDSEDHWLFAQGAFGQAQHDALFRSDVVDPPAPSTTLAPFGLGPACRRFLDPTLIPPDAPGNTAGLTHDYGNTGSIWDVDEQFKEGVDRFDQFGGITRVGGLPIIQQDRALAGRIAVNIANTAWTEVMGYPLTISHSYSRNAGQRDQLLDVTEWFVRMGFSPRWLLRRIVLSPYFNRMAPSLHGGDPYDLPAVYDPFVVAPPNASNPPSHERFNAMTDGVQAYSARNALTSVAKTMGWAGPPDFPSPGYPEWEFVTTMGMFERDSLPGGRGIGFGNLLAWDDVVANGERQGAQPDWVDRVMSEIPVFDAAHPNEELTIEDLVVTAKDWVLSDGTIASTPTSRGSVERDVLEDYFGVALTDRAASIQPAELEDLLRGLVGVYLQSPQYLLAGIAAPQLGDAPRMRVCTDGPCTYRELCESYRSAIEGARHELTCNDDSLSVEYNPGGGSASLAHRFADLLCEGMPCELVERAPRPDCLSNPASCGGSPPPCDPRCDQGAACCGDLRMNDSLEGMFVIWGEGAVLQEATGVTVLRAGGDSWKEVGTSYPLQYGDLLAFEPGATFVIETEYGTISPPDGEVPENPETGAWTMIVSGQEAIERPDYPASGKPPPIDWKAMSQDWSQRNGGRPPF